MESKRMIRKKCYLLLFVGFIIEIGLGPGEITAQKIGALGYIAPAGGIIELHGPAGDIIEEIMVKRGDSVDKDTPLVRFHSHREKELEVALKRGYLREADELGMKNIELQRLRVKAAEEDHRYASDNYNRFSEIDGKTISVKQMALYEHEYTRSSVGLQTARAELDRLVLKRDIDMARAGNHLALALSRPSILQAPIKGTVLDIPAQPGEAAGVGPVIRMADLDRMVVVAEVFETDVLKLAPGMVATITHRSLPADFSGIVESIGRIISGQSKIIRVRVRLNEARPASQLINLEVDVTFQVADNGQEN